MNLLLLIVKADLLKSLKIMGLGLLAIAIVITVLILSVTAIRAIDNKLTEVKEAKLAAKVEEKQDEQ